MASRLNLNHGAIAVMLDGAVKKELRRRTLRVERRAKQLCPVDTGRLRTSIESSVTTDAKGPVGRVGSEVEYALWVETGTSRAAAQPFLRPALAAETAE